MKKVKLILIAVVFATAFVNTAQADGSKMEQGRNIIKLTLLQAIQDPGLVTAMYQQLNGGFLGGPGITYITLTVRYHNHVYLISATQDQWNIFFTYKGITEKPIKK